MVPARDRVPDTRYQAPGTYNQEPGTCYQAPSVKDQLPGTWYKVPRTWYQVVQGTMYRVAPGTTWYQAPDTWYLVLGIRYQVVVVVVKCLPVDKSCCQITAKAPRLLLDQTS